MEFLLERRDGVSAQTMAQARRCVSSDLEELAALQSAVRAAMPRPELFIPNTREELARDLAESLCIGVWAEGALAAYVILRYCGDSRHNYAAYLDIPPCDWKYWANGDSAVVAPRWRGNGLQQRMIRLMEEWRRPEIIGIGCTVSPDNAYSLNNVQAMGFSVHTRCLMYGSNDRYVLKKQLTPLPGRYRHFKGNQYQVLEMATHSETREPMVVYRALYGERGLWVRPASMWFAHIERDGYAGPRFVYAGE